VRDRGGEAQRVVTGLGGWGQRRRTGQVLDVIAHAVVQGQVGLDAPGVLREEAQRRIGELRIGIAESLDEVAGQAQAVRLHRVEVGEGHIGDVGGEAQAGGADAGEVVHTSEVHREGGVERQVVDVGAELEAVVAFDQREIVAHLVPLLHAVDKRKRLAPKERDAGNVDGHIAASRPA
jgi:hypothetical protein